MATRRTTKKNNTIYYILGAGALAGGLYFLYPKIKAYFTKPEDTQLPDPNDPTNQVITNVITPGGVQPVAKTITSGLSPLGTPKDQLNIDQVLKFGDKGQEIAKAQQILNRIAEITKKPKVTEDGIYGDGTQARLAQLFTDQGAINLYKLYIALFAIWNADQGKALKNWFSTYQTYLASPVLRQAGRKNYFSKNKLI
jgi:hypothetical protein